LSALVPVLTGSGCIGNRDGWRQAVHTHGPDIAAASRGTQSLFVMDDGQKMGK
jgi:hypothetical protein